MMQFSTKTAILTGALAVVASAQQYGSGYGSSDMSVGSTASMAAASLANTGTITTSSSTATASGIGMATHTVDVGEGGKLVYNPSSFTAAVGDHVVFKFYPMNHSVAQASFGSPCQPLAGGVFSGYLPVSDATKNSVFTYIVKDLNPFWYYCATAKHCQAGMVGVINPPTDSNSQLSNFAAAASTAASNVPGATVTGGSVSTAGQAAATTTGSSSGSSSSSGKATAASASSSSSSGLAQPTGAGIRELYAGAALAGAALFAVGL